MTRDVVAAFEPFGGRRTNRSWQAVQAMPDDAEVERVQLPVDFARLPDIVGSLARRARCLLLVGESGQTRVALVERIALNLADASIADNAGARPSQEPLLQGGPLARPATWDATAIARAVAAAGAKVGISHHAGTFACNASLYLALSEAATRQDPAIVGFLHVPAYPWPLGRPLAELARGLRAALLTMRAAHATNGRLNAK